MYTHLWCAHFYVIDFVPPLQCLMLMGTLFDVDGLSQLSVSVMMCVRCFQLHWTRLVHNAYDCNCEE